MSNPSKTNCRVSRRGAIIVWAAILMVVLLGMIAFAVDVGYMYVVRTELQAASDSAALAGGAVMGETDAVVRQTAKEFAAENRAGSQDVSLADSDIEIGTWNEATRQFTPNVGRNAIRVTARRSGGSLFFGRVFKRSSFDADTQSVVAANPRDIAFTIDLSGSMNDDAEPCWATDEINAAYAGGPYSGIGTSMMQKLYSDLGFGTYPGTTQWVGAPAGIAANDFAYAELTKNGSLLTSSSVPSQYRISSSDSEATRKLKAYRAIIDFQIAPLMPKAKPTPNSSTSYAYWARYLDYLLTPVYIHSPPPPSPGGGGGGGRGGGGGGGPSGPSPPMGMLEIENPFRYASSVERDGERFDDLLLASASDLPLTLALGGASIAASSPGTPPIDRGWLPPSQSSPRINNYNNPNGETYPGAEVPWEWRNKIGYRTYVQFLLDAGRDEMIGGSPSMLCVDSPYCPMHTETTAAGPFSFPPREEPMHSVRRSIIAALFEIEQVNQLIPTAAQRDRVSIVTFDKQNATSPRIVVSLTTDYRAAMTAVARLQACSDQGQTTATEAGINLAESHIKPTSQGGAGRERSDKIVLLMTDGVPNLYESSQSAISSYKSSNSSSDWVGGGYYWIDAALMASHRLEAKGWEVYAVGVGLGADRDFLDRMSRMGGTANDQGGAPKPAGNPAEYEEMLRAIFEEIVNSPQVRLVN